MAGRVKRGSVWDEPSATAQILRRIRSSSKVYLWALIGLGILQGLTYAAVIPPWQHYDEPTHLERLYWVTESLSAAPHPSSALSLPVEIAASMCESRFWREASCPYLPLPYAEPPELSTFYVPRQPIYYYLASPLQLLLRNSSIELRLYTGRLVSTAMYVLSLLVAHWLLRDLFPGDREIPWVVPVLIALVPAYADIATAVNNDVAAILAFALLLWGIVRLMRDGISLWTLTWVAGAAILAWFSKRTATIGVLLGLIAVVVGSRLFRRWMWLIGGLGVCGLLVATITLTGSASWYELGGSSVDPVRTLSAGPLGDHVMCVRGGRSLVQDLPHDLTPTLQGQTVTLGAWVRTKIGEGQRAAGLALYDGQRVHAEAAMILPEWTFQSTTVTLSSRLSALQVRLLAPSDGTTVCYDGIVLAQGTYPLSEMPEFADRSAQAGTWGAQSFENLLDNGSAEQSWPRLTPQASALILKLDLTRGLDPNLYLHSILDWRRTGWVYGMTWANLWSTFWGRFGWNSVDLPGWMYQVLYIITGLGIVGGSVSFALDLFIPSRLQDWQRRALGLLGLAALLVWGVSLFHYGHPLLAGLPRIYLAVARYVYPTIVPTTLILYAGWRWLLPGRWRLLLPVLSLSAMAILNAASLLGTILPFFYLS